MRCRNSKPFRVRRAIHAGVLLATCWAVRADDERDFFRVSLEELLRVPVTVASRTGEDALHAPSTVTVFTREEIEMLGVRTVFELLDYVPGLTTTYDSRNAQNAPSVHVRGVHRGDFGTHVLVRIDGQRLNRPVEGGANLNFRLLSAGDVERIEVIRGPGSALYGNNAFLAVVDIQTRRHGREFLAMVGPEGTFEARGAVTRNYGTTELSLYALLRDDVGQQYRLPTGVEVDDPRQNMELHAGIRRGKLQLDLFQYAPTSHDGIMFYSPGQGINRAAATSRGVRVSLEHEFADRGALSLFLGHLRSEGESLALGLPAGADGGLGPIPFDLIGGSYNVSTQSELRTELSVSFAQQHELLLGVSLEQEGVPENRIDSNYLGLVPDPAGYLGEVRRQETEYSRSMDGRRRSIQAVYLQDRFSIADAWLGFIGLRVDHYEFVGAAVNPRAALIWSALDQLAFKAQFGSAFRAPSISEQYLSSPITIANRDLKPEHVRTWEVGGSYRFSVLGFDANYFYTEFDEEIVAQVTGRTITRVNGPTHHVDGFELQATLQSVPYLRVIGNVSLIDDGAADDGFERLASVRFFSHIRALDFTVTARYRGEQPSLPAQDPYWLFDAQVRWQVDEATRFFVRAENVLDMTYSTYGAGFEENDYQLRQRRRELLLGVQWDWGHP